MHSLRLSSLSRRVEQSSARIPLGRSFLSQTLGQKQYLASKGWCTWRAINSGPFESSVESLRESSSCMSPIVRIFLNEVLNAKENQRGCMPPYWCIIFNFLRKIKTVGTILNRKFETKYRDKLKKKKKNEACYAQESINRGMKWCHRQMCQ